MGQIDWSKTITREQRDAAAEQAAWDALRDERDKKFVATRWLVERHAEELALGLDTTLTPEQHIDLLAYRQALRDLPDIIADPEWPDWPEVPGALADDR